MKWIITTLKQKYYNDPRNLFLKQYFINIQKKKNHLKMKSEFLINKTVVNRALLYKEFH